jgi:ATP-binding cassette subfamily B protein
MSQALNNLVIDSLRDAIARLSNLPRAFRLIWAAASSLTLVWAILLVVQGLLPVATIYLSRLLIDRLVAALSAVGSWERVGLILFPVILLIGVTILSELLQSVAGWLRAAQSEFIQDHINGLIHEKSVAVDMAFYESAEYHDHLYRARDDASYRSLALLESMGGLLQNSLTLLAMAAMLIPYGAWLPVVLLASTAPAFYVLLRFDLRYHQWWQQTTADRRWTQYYDWMLVESMVAAELRLFDLGAHFQSAYKALRQRLRSEHLQLIKSQSLACLGANLIALVISGATMAWMVWRALQGLATLGDLALFYQVFQRGQNVMRSLLGDMEKIYSNSLFLNNLFEFLALKPRVTDPPEPLPAPVTVREEIRFRNITFRYPGSERTALQQFNLCIPAGQIVAIVGANGAGKSTLVKLLCRFYDPEGGQVELDGIDIRELSNVELRRLITVLFQSPVAYHATAGQNIVLGDLATAAEASEIEAAARSAGAHEVIARLPRSYDTLLGKWFTDGAELSGGEWQRIALARAFLRRAPIIILDEPTSSMDSWAEADWLERLRSLVDGRTVLIITHRFTTAMRADIIHVMHEGQIVESGSHAELLACGGRYARSWTAQTQAASELADEAFSVDHPPWT